MKETKLGYSLEGNAIFRNKYVNSSYHNPQENALDLVRKKDRKHDITEIRGDIGRNEQDKENIHSTFIVPVGECGELWVEIHLIGTEF